MITSLGGGGGVFHMLYFVVCERLRPNSVLLICLICQIIHYLIFLRFFMTFLSTLITYLFFSLCFYNLIK